MFLGSKEDVFAAIQRLIEEQPVDEPLGLAVAFWGQGSELLITPAKRYRVICNLTEGGTNPSVIRELIGRQNVEVRYLPGLHAKVVLGRERAIVGSANFSANGLGLGSDPSRGWHEAAAIVNAQSVVPWFEKHWQAALEVTSKTLFAAELKWEARELLHQELAVGGPPVDETDTTPRLLEAELFKSRITGGNKIRMAARQIENIYFDEIEPETKRSVWNPAYAASIIWTEAGNRIQTRIDQCPYFESPTDVLNRAKHAKTIEKVHHFIRILSLRDDVSPAIRYWATQYLGKTS